MGQYKKCKICELEKSLDNFSKRKSSSDGHRHQCKECIKTQKKEYYNKNKVYLSEKNKIWRENNKDRLKENYENFLNNNPSYQKEYYNRNKVKINNKYNIRRNEDDLFRFKENIRNLIKNSIIGNGYSKKSKTNKILGCSYEEFKEYIELQWEDWMNWDNYGNPKDGIIEPNKTWDIDHIKPLKLCENEIDIIEFNHYSNLQPLCSYNNRFVKKDNYGSLLQ